MASTWKRCERMLSETTPIPRPVPPSLTDDADVHVLWQAQVAVGGSGGALRDVPRHPAAALVVLAARHGVGLRGRSAASRTDGDSMRRYWCWAVGGDPAAIQERAAGSFAHLQLQHA